MCRPDDGWKGGRIFRINLTSSEANQAYAESLGVEETPTFILFDKAGKEVRRWVSETPQMGELP